MGAKRKRSMTLKAERKPPGLSIEAFRAFYHGRPDEERWELIDGVPMMMAPPTFVHQRIASNLERLLNDALEVHEPTRAAYQRGGLNLKRAVSNYDPEPDAVVVDVVLAPDQHYADRFYLAAEVVSDSDRKTLTGKREIYKLHEHCTCILTVRQDRCHVRIDTRTATGWQVKLLAKPTDVLALADFGVRCRVGDLYKGTPLQPRSVRRTRG
jgi:Uma2 family endonuclease